MNGKVFIDKYPLSKIHLDNEVIEIKEKNLLNRSLDGDIVSIIDNKINKIIKRKEFKIVGILNITSRVKFGVNKRGNPVFMFKSLDKKYPDFLVSSTITKKNKNLKDHYVIISFHKWEDNKQYPIGKIEHIIGEIGNYNNEYEMILYKFNLNFKNLKKENLEIINDDISIKENIFSIDPIGCKDIDDTLHVKKKINGYELGIHIADVSYYINADSKLDKLIKKRLTSIYINDYKQINMLPNNLSTDLISLLPNKKRRAFSIIFDIDENFIINKICYKKNIIKSKFAYSYKEVDEILEGKNDFLKNDIILAKTIAENISKQKVDSHKLIETFMILANESVGNEIYKKFPDKAIIRVHSDKEKQLKFNFDKINEIKNENLKNHLKILSFNSAEYVITKNIKKENMIHYGLGIKIYTHFTSPIRRYADIIVHRMLNCIINNENYEIDNSNLCIEMNEINNKIKKADREFEKIKILKSFENENISEIETEGYVTKINNFTITIYIPRYNISHNCIVINKKLSNIVDIKSDDYKININYKNIDSSFEINLLDKIDIRITNLINEKSIINKMKITIIRPNLMDLFN